MVSLVPSCRQAFRRLHGLAPTAETPPLSPADREVLAAQARRHRLTGLLQAGLSAEAGFAMPTAAFGQAQRAARFAQEAERLFALLAPRLRRLALLKGPALAAQAWPQLGLRSCDDLDFLCDPGDFAALVAGLAAAGYAPETDHPRHLAHLWHYGWGAAFRHPDGFLVEANRRFFPPQYPWPGRCNGRWKTAFAPVRLEEAEVRAPTPALHLLLSCLHAVWHGWARLAWLVDVAGLLVRHPAIFPQALALARRCSFAEQALIAGCGVADALFGPNLAAPPLPAAPAAAVAEAVALLDGAARPLGGRELRRLHERFMTPAEIAFYRLRRTFTPGDGDFRWIALPIPLRGLYWLLRPLRGALYDTHFLKPGAR